MIVVSIHLQYMGVTVTQNPSWEKHISIITSKANSTRAFLHRNLKGCSRKIKSRCYLSLVRPRLEYSSSIWDPHQAKYVQKLEMVQRRAARSVMNDYSRKSSVTAMMSKLKWDSLQSRRQDNKVTLLYKLVNGLVEAPDCKTSLRTTSVKTRGHQTKLFVPRSSTDAHRFSFIPSAIRLWNDLPASVASAADLTSFKNGLQQTHSCQ